VDDLQLSAANREAAHEAVRAYQANGRTVTSLASSALILKMKEVLTPQEYQKFRQATDSLRRGPGGGRVLSVDDMVEHLMSFDKNKDGKLTKDELPERMHDLIAKGDTNKDGALDKEEIKKLAADLAKDRPLLAGGLGGGFPPGPGGRGGFGNRGSAATMLPARAVERALEDLKLSGAAKEKANAAVKAYRERLRQLTELARTDLLLTMTDLLNEAEFKKFKAAVDRQPDFSERPIPPGGRNPGLPPDPLGLRGP
jgi:hypothetical protein